MDVTSSVRYHAIAKMTHVLTERSSVSSHALRQAVRGVVDAPFGRLTLEHPDFHGTMKRASTQALKLLGRGQTDTISGEYHWIARGSAAIRATLFRFATVCPQPHARIVESLVRRTRLKQHATGSRMLNTRGVSCFND